MKTLLGGCCLAGLLLGLVGCGQVDAALDCHDICSRYASCYDTSYDVDACETRCRNASKVDATFRRNADVCNACITDRACASATFSCANECSTVVP